MSGCLFNRVHRKDFTGSSLQKNAINQIMKNEMDSKA